MIHFVHDIREAVQILVSAYNAEKAERERMQKVIENLQDLHRNTATILSDLKKDYKAFKAEHPETVKKAVANALVNA